MPTVYRCRFKLHGEHRMVDSPNGIQEFSHGFWVNEELQLCPQSQDKFWVPPSAITHITKVETP